MSDLNPSAPGSANPVDRHVGLRIRMRRKELGISQETLAEAIGLTFQQVQKYERATNRVSASKLWEMAQAMNTSVAYFYDGLEGDAEFAEALRDGVTQAFLTSHDGAELAAAYRAIRQPRVRRRILDLVRAMAGQGEPLPV